MTGRFLALRLRGYGEATASVLMRRWQFLLLCVGTVAPIGGSLLGVAAYPVLVVADPEHSVAWRLGAIGLWQGCWALWALMQREALRGGAFADYARALPLSASTRRRVDAVVLLVGNTPLLVFFVAAAVTLAMPDVSAQGAARDALLQGAALDTARGALLIVFLLATQWCAQHAVLDRRPRALPGLIALFVVIDVWAALTLGLPGEWAIVLTTPAVIAAIWALVNDVPALAIPPGHLLGRIQAAGARWLGAVLRRLPPADRLTLGILYRQHCSMMLGTFFTCTLVTFAARGLMQVWLYDGRSLPMTIIAFGIIALAISSLYRPLQMAHDAARSYTAALPLRSRWWVRADTLALVLFAMPFAVALALPLGIDAGVSWAAIVAGVASLVFLVVLLRVPQLFSRRHAVITSMVFTSGWTFVIAHLLAT